jgi:hypothetical protein
VRVILAATVLSLLCSGPAAAEPAPEPTKDQQERFRKCLIEGAVLRYYVDWDPRTEDICGANAVTAAAKVLDDDPAAAYFTGFAAENRGRDLAARCRAVGAGLKTSQASLCLAALMWRDLAECCLDGRPAAERTAEEQKLLRETMTALAAKAAEWQARTFKEKLGDFLFREMNTAALKARSSAPAYVSIGLALGAKRWGPRPDQVDEAYLAAHPFGESMQIGLAGGKDSGLVLIRAGKEAPAEADFKLGVFDLLQTPGKPGEATVTVTLTDHDLKVAVKLPAGGLLAYADVLRLAYEQNRAALDAKTAERWGWPLSLPAWRTAAGEGAKPPAAETEARIAALVADLGHNDWNRRDAASRELKQIGAPALPALRKAAGSVDAEVKARAAELVAEIEKPAEDRLRDARIRVVSLWLF